MIRAIRPGVQVITSRERYFSLPQRSKDRLLTITRSISIEPNHVHFMMPRYLWLEHSETLLALIGHDAAVRCIGL